MADGRARRVLCVSLALAVLLVASGEARAHWCNNIWSSPARLVVKPEKTTVNVGAGATQLRVYLRNNFPYKIFDAKMRGDAPGYDVPETPGQTIHPGQETSYMLEISGGAAGDVEATSLNLQVRFRVDSWRGDDDCLVNQSPGENMLVARSEYGNSSPACGADNQSASLTAATLADKQPSKTLGAGAPTFGRTGLEQLIHFFGYRFCYSSSGGWRSGDQDCPSPAAEGNPWTSVQQFPQNCMRAGVELAVRKAKLGSKLDAARDAALNALEGGGPEHKCLAAVVGGYLFQGGDTGKFSSALSASDLPQACKNAGMRALDGSNASGGCSGAHHEEAACAAAEGLNGNDGPVKSVLMSKAGDGDQGGYEGLYSAYMLYLVAGHYRATTGGVPFYPDAGGSKPQPDVGPPPGQDGGGTVTPGQDGGGTVTPGQDGGGTVTPPTGDGGTTNPAGDGGSDLDGGCAVSAGPASLPALLCLLAALLAFRRRRS